MIRKSTRTLFRSFYREVLPQAFTKAWKEQWLWPWAILASVFVSGGIFDVAANIYDQVRQTGSLLLTPSIYQGFLQLPLPQFVGTLIFFVAFVLISCFAQGVVCYAHGGRATAQQTLASQSIQAGKKHLGKILALTIVTGLSTWIIRFVLLIPLLVSETVPNTITVLVMIFATIAYLVLAVLLTATHLFALNAIVHQGAFASEAILRAWILARTEWLHLVELGLALWLTNAIALIAAGILFVVMAIPLYLVLVATALLNQTAGFQLTMTLGYFLFVVVMLIVAAITVSFQYGVWHHLYLRLGEGGIAPKIHRLARWFMGKA